MAAMGATGDTAKTATVPGLLTAQLSTLTAILRSIMKETAGLGAVCPWRAVCRVACRCESS